MGQESLDRLHIYRFKIDKQLGSGGTGTVYRGLDTENGNIVAVKLFNSGFFRNRLHLREFSRNVAKFCKLSHRNLAGVLEFITGKEGNCLVQEYIDGPDLKWYIANRDWNVQERLVIVAQICNGLQFIHDQGSVHHDLKPANILFTRKGVAKLSDYCLGHSRLMALFDPNYHEQITPMYVAPELIRKEKACPQSDIYSLGVTCYILFAGRVPFEVDTLQKLYNCHLQVNPEHPTVFNPKCPEAVGDIIMRMLDKQPENRFKDCDELRIVLANVGRSRI